LKLGSLDQFRGAQLAIAHGDFRPVHLKVHMGGWDVIVVRDALHSADRHVELVVGVKPLPLASGESPRRDELGTKALQQR